MILKTEIIVPINRFAKYWYQRALNFKKIFKKKYYFLYYFETLLNPEFMEFYDNFMTKIKFSPLILVKKILFWKIFLLKIKKCLI